MAGSAQLLQVATGRQFLQSVNMGAQGVDENRDHGSSLLLIQQIRGFEVLLYGFQICCAIHFLPTYVCCPYSFSLMQHKAFLYLPQPLGKE
jgi:hypothetical protein